MIAVIVEENERNRLGTEPDFIKRWFVSKNMQRVTTHFISADQVNKQKELI
jgi:uncharacterized protein YndB with AHSA1/START domain